MAPAGVKKLKRLFSITQHHMTCIVQEERLFVQAEMKVTLHAHPQSQSQFTGAGGCCME